MKYYNDLRDYHNQKFINENLLYESIARINKTADDKIITQVINTIKRIDNPSLFANIAALQVLHLQYLHLLC